MTQQEMIKVLEPLVDATSTADVVLALARLCNEKAEHVAINLQDASLAKKWNRNANLLDRLSASFTV